MSSAIQLPPWAREVVARFESQAAGEFLLHGNVDDRVLVNGGPEGPRLGRLLDFLLDRLLPRFDVVLSFDLGHGIRVERGGEIFTVQASLQ